MDSYIRVSRVGGRAGPEFQSPEAQRDAIERYASQHHIQLDVPHEDLDESGARMERPGFDALMDRIESGQTDGVIVAKLDRFGRSLIGSLEALTRIDKAGAKFISVAENFDTTTPAGRGMLKITLVLAEMEWERIRDQWADSRARAVARGIHIASRVPTGYNKGDDGRLVPNDDAEHIPTLFKLKAGGASWKELADYLNDHQVTGPYNAQNWTQRSIGGIIANPVYLGQARSGEFTNDDAHEAIIDRGTWEAAQNRRPDIHQRNGEGPLLSGLLRCGGCRHLMKPDTVKLRDGTRVRTYRCRGDHASGKCRARSYVMAGIIEPYVVQEFVKLVEDEQAIGVPDERKLEQAGMDLANAEYELAAYVEADPAGIVGVELFRKGLEKRQERAQEARRRLAEAQPNPTFAIDIRKLWDDLRVSEQRQLVGSVLDAVVLMKGRKPIAQRVHILRHGGMDDTWPTSPDLA